jgi:hypothetical protein
MVLKVPSSFWWLRLSLVPGERSEFPGKPRVLKVPGKNYITEIIISLDKRPFECLRVPECIFLVAHREKIKPLHPPHLNRFTRFTCFYGFYPKHGNSAFTLFLPYFFLDEKVSKKSRLKRMIRCTLVTNRMLQVISSQARSFLCI